MNNSIILKYKIVFFSTIFGLNLSNAQILTNNGMSSTIANSNVLLDGSSNFSTETGAGSFTGKGIVIPSVDLVNFAFDLTLADGSTFPTYFDGMIVYNNATGTTLTTGNRSSLSTAVSPGFYYFSNPDGAINSNVTGGTWKPLSGSSSAEPIRLVSTNITLDATHKVVLVDTSSSNITVTLPAASASVNRIFNIIKSDQSSNKIIFSTPITIYGNSTFTELNVPGEYKIQSDGTNWYLII